MTRTDRNHLGSSLPPGIDQHGNDPAVVRERPEVFPTNPLKFARPSTLNAGLRPDGRRAAVSRSAPVWTPFLEFQLSRPRGGGARRRLHPVEIKNIEDVGVVVAEEPGDRPLMPADQRSSST